MRSGKLKQEITLEEPVAVSGNYGNTQSWVDHITVRASVESLSGKKYFEAKQNNHELTTEVRMRYLSTITDKMRINYQGKILEIISLINIREENKELLIMCSEKT